MRLAGGDSLMPLVGASSIYRPPVAGEPIRLREDGHWSADKLVAGYYMTAMRGGIVQDVSRFENHGTLSSGTSWASDLRTRTRIAFDGDQGGMTTVAPALLAVPMSIFAIVTPTAYPYTYHHIVGQRSDLAFDWQLRVNNTANLSFLGTTAVVSSLKPHLGATAYIGVVVTSSNLTFYLNGQSQTTAPVAIGSATVALSVGRLLTQTAANGHAWSGSIHRVLLYGRAATVAQFDALSAAPDLPIWRPRRGISLALLTETAAGRIIYPWHTPGFNAGLGRL